MSSFSHSIPVMTCAETKNFEKDFFSQGKMSEESAMNAAGTLVGETVLRELGREKIHRLLVLAGKGHNAGDAIRAATTIFSKTACQIFVVFFAEDGNVLAPLTRKFFDEFLAVVPDEKRRVAFLSEKENSALQEILAFAAFPRTVFIDGIFGHSFRPPFPSQTKIFVEKIFAVRTKDSFCVAVDLPSGLCDSGSDDCVVQADMTCPTGILKRPVLAFPQFVGRVVPVDIAFRDDSKPIVAVCDENFFLKKIFSRRATLCDKRDFGHVLIVGGSRSMPGALMLNVRAALRAGAGLVSVICPESVQSAFAARAPSAMWIPCRENDSGGLDFSSAFSEFEKILPRVSAVLCGSGMGTSPDAQKLIQKIAESVPAEIPVIFDADALRVRTLEALKSRAAPASKTILLPHAGEFLRLGGDADALMEFCEKNKATVALKGVCTRVAGSSVEFLTFAGTPALARGGSGDVLAGIVAALFASEKNFSQKCTSEERLVAAVIWHGTAARRLSTAQAERCADISALPDFLALSEFCA